MNLVRKPSDNELIIKPIRESTSSWFKIFKNFFGVLFWSYVIIKLFIFDIDLYIIKKIFPEFIDVLNYKIFILFGTIAFIWFFIKSKKMLAFIVYIAFYPVILLFWKLPYYIFKQRNWDLAFAIINSIISFIVSIKYNFILSAFYLVFTVITFKLENELFLWFSVVIITLILVLMYFDRVISIFKPSAAFKFYINILGFLNHVGQNGFSAFQLDESSKNLPVEQLNEKQLEKRKTTLQQSVLVNRVLLFTGKKLKNYQKSNFNYIYYIVTIVGLTLFTILSFSIINLGIYKISSSNFGYEIQPSFFTFIYYSFNNLLSTPISELKAITPISQGISMATTFFAFFMLAIFIALIISVKSKKHEMELDNIIIGFEEQGESMEKFILNEYKINSLDDALIELEKLKATLIKIIFKISDNIK